jgi:hypothetical protein
VCWGLNNEGQVGDGSGLDQRTPTAVNGFPGGAAAIATGWSHTCAVTTGGGVLCWGDDYYGQLGLGRRTLSTSPLAVYGRGGVLSASSVSPSHGSSSGGTPVTISGAYLLDGASVTIGGVAASDVVVVNTETISARTGAHASGLVDVTVHNPDGSEATLAGSFTYETPPPGAFDRTWPTNGMTGIPTSTTLTWDASAGATGYEYCYDTSNDNACAGWTGAGTNPSAALSGLALATTYYWHVRATNGGGTTYAGGSAAAYWSFTTVGPPPGAFGKTAPADGATGVSSNPTLTWGVSSGAVGYAYCYDTTNDGACSPWTTTGTSRSVTLSGLAAATTYYWQVRALNDSASTYADGAVHWRFTTVPPAPGAFGKTAPANGATGVSTSPTLTWGASSGATSYAYCYDTTNDNACGTWTSTGASTSVALSGLAQGTTYYWHVRATNSGGTTYADAGAAAFWSFTARRRPGSDFTGDFKSDILWRHATQGYLWLWPMDGGAHTPELYVSTVSEPGWEIRGLGDQTGDGQADILWRHATTGQVYLWTMDGSTAEAMSYVGTVHLAFDIVGTGDYDGDGRSDILWRHATTGALWLWRMNGPATLDVTYVDTVDLGYEIQGTGDLNADGKADLVWQGTAGDVWVWLMNGPEPIQVAYVTTVGDLGYRIAGVAYYTGDGRADLLWHHATRGEMWLWEMNGVAKLSEAYVGTVPDINYRIVGTGDYDGDGQADILWHHATAGDVWVWLMSGAVKVSEHYVGGVPDTGYQIVEAK